MPSVIIFGGGRIGRYLYDILEASHKVTIVDPVSPKVSKYDWIPGGIVTDREAVKGYDYCVNAVPIYDPKIVLSLIEACVFHHVHYLDFSEDMEIGDMIAGYADVTDTPILIAPHCGLAPGLINILGNDLAEGLDTVDTIDLRVGALPCAVSNPIKYLSTWSIEGLVNEYLKPCPVLKNGRRELVPALSLYDELIIDGRLYESFATSGGCSTMLDSWEGRANSVTYRSIRYPGHHDAMLRIITNAAGDRKKIIEAIEQYQSSDGVVQDMVTIFTRATGTKDGQRVENSLVFETFGDSAASAIKRTTAGSLAVVIDLHAKGLIKQSGYLRQEEISWPVFLSSGEILFDRLLIKSS